MPHIDNLPKYHEGSACYAESVFEPTTVRQRVIKWSVIALLLALGIGSFLLQYDELSAFQKARKNPVYVQAIMHVRAENRGVSPEISYVTTLSYECYGKRYEDVFYRSRKSPNHLKHNGEVVTLAVNPEDPGELLEQMYKPIWMAIPIVLGTIGIACLIYGIAIEQEHFRKWRLNAAVRKQRLALTPDYIADVLIIWLPVVILASALFVLSF